MNGPKFLCYERRKISILVIEQETQIHPLLQMALQPHGFDLKFAANFQHGLNLLAQHRQEIAIVLLGGSTLGINTAQTLTAIRSLKPQIVIVVMTGDVVAHDPGQLANLGVAYVLKKPFHVAELTQVLLQFVNTKEQDSPATEPERAPSEEDEHVK